jgi:hypothetical protein
MIHGFDGQAYQKKIDAITGLNREGKSIYRVVHAPSVWTWALGERMPRYWTRRWKESGGWKYEQPDRFVFECRLEKEVYWAAHEATRYQDIDGSGTIVDLGPPPEDYFMPDAAIVRHDELTDDAGTPLCCKRAWEGETKYVLDWRGVLVAQQVGGRQRCWGLPGMDGYREPDDSDLEAIRAAMERMKADPYRNPYAPLSSEQLAVVEIEANMDAQRVAEEARKLQSEINREFNRLHGWRLTNTDAGKRSKFHFLTGG